MPKTLDSQSSKADQEYKLPTDNWKGPLPTDKWKGPLPTDSWKKPLPLEPWKDTSKK